MKTLYNIKKSFLGLLSVGLLAGCTDLTVEPTDSIYVEEEGGNPTELLESLYRSGFGPYNGYSSISALINITSDLHIPPTRTTGDWADGGKWRSLHTHEWTPTHPEVNSTWSSLNRSVFNASQILFFDPSAQQAAEAKYLRAYFMWQLLDLFGVVPFREVDEGVEVDPRVMTRKEALDFVIGDLDDAIATLPSSGPSNHKTATKEAALALKARVYLNKAVYESDAPGNYSFSAGDMNEVIESADAISNVGYSLSDDYYSNFREGTSSENILLYQDPASRINWNGYLHGSQGGWNGFSITPEMYDLYESGDDRLGKGPGTDGYVFDADDFDPDNSDVLIPQGILVGQQYRKDGTTIDANYQKEAQLLGADPNEGYKLVKYTPDFPTPYVLVRYGDVVLMKAEAILRGGSSSETALDVVNELRQNRNASVLTSVSLDDILDERAREMQWDNVRRTDQMRFGTFLSGGWTEKGDSSDGNSFRWLFPIPSIQVSLNPNLEQNPNY